MKRKFPVLILHGFTSSLKCIEKPGEKLLEMGFEVSMPILAGHGKTPEALIGVKSSDWYEDAEKELLRLHSSTGHRVGVVGLSMGGLAGLNLSIRHPDKIHFFAGAAPALIFKNPLTPLSRILAKFVKFWPSPNSFVDSQLKKKYNENYSRFPTSSFVELYEWSLKTIENLEKVTVPVFLQHSLRDQVISIAGSRLIMEKINSPDRYFKEYKTSGHEMFLDLESDKIVQDLADFIDNFEKSVEEQK
ncbi:MAG: alpha/beta fold hydrolase [Deltaproteobacteria bacterium]|nr:alpha/beta fold hydrolase [Deltaproteobacteria bacterium]